ncbi:hypothetical protein Taro_012361 [Colocasia esculenta]|uniref:Uncharacterized protein n=1 Tax=Colocasia esculenta TaxID=4460 RepID=A0A843UIV9_COLES|nr:hypothetical protein [Colocasia esculenta]
MPWSRIDRDRFLVAFWPKSRQTRCHIQVTTACASPSQIEEALVDPFEVFFHCDSIFLALVLFLAQCYSSLSPGARHLRACSRDRLLPLPGPPIPTRLFEGVLQVVGELESQTLVRLHSSTFRGGLRRRGRSRWCLP